MDIVEIWWFIKPNETDAAGFLDYWRRIATIDDKTGLFGEFMSEPYVPKPSRYPVDDLSSPHGSYWLYKNFGLWRSEQDFYLQVGRKITGRILPFEAPGFPRKRYVHRNLERRLGDWPIPAATCT